MTAQEPDVNEPTEDQNDLDEQQPGAAADATEQGQEPTVEVPAHDAETTKLREERDQLEQKLQRAVDFIVSSQNR